MAWAFTWLSLFLNAVLNAEALVNLQKKTLVVNNRANRNIPSIRGGYVFQIQSVPTIMSRDAAVAGIGLIGASLWLQIWTRAASLNLIDPKLSRKIVHTGSAPLFLLVRDHFAHKSETSHVSNCISQIDMDILYSKPACS